MITIWMHLPFFYSSFSLSFPLLAMLSIGWEAYISTIKSPTKSIGLFLIFFLSLTCYAKVDPPNYNFSLDAFQLFRPGNTVEEIKKKYPRFEVIDQKADSYTLKVYVAHLRYRFPVFIQIFRDKSVDFIARLPNYFLHDLFHQSLINRYGKQDSYRKREESALYIWNGAKDGVKKIYNGTCTITCFPVWYAEESLAPPVEFNGYQSLLKKFDEAVAVKENIPFVLPTKTASPSTTATDKK